MLTPIRAVFSTLVLLLAAGAALADEAAKTAKIEEMLQLTKADQMINQMLDQVRSMQTQQLARMDLPPERRARAQEMQSKISQLISASLSWEKLRPQYVKLYSDAFTEEELAAILAFYKSPAGRAMLEKMPQLMLKSMSIGQQAVANIQPEIERLVREEQGKQ